MKFTVKMDKNSEKSESFDYNLVDEAETPADRLQGLVNVFGLENIIAAIVDNIIIAAQAQCRRLMKHGKTRSQIQEFLDTWKYGEKVERMPRQLTAEDFKKYFETLSADEQAKLLMSMKG